MLHDDEQGIRLIDMSDRTNKIELNIQVDQTPINDIQQQQKNDMPHEIIHNVTIDDSLEGLSLQYGVSIGRIKQRNNLHGDDIYYLKSLIIPDPKCNNEGQTRTPEELLRLKQEYAISGLMNELEKEDRSHKVARYYLQENDWDVYRAAAEYRQHLEWQKKQKETELPPALVEQKKKISTILNMRLRPMQMGTTPAYPEVELALKKQA